MIGTSLMNQLIVITTITITVWQAKKKHGLSEVDDNSKTTKNCSIIHYNEI